MENIKTIETPKTPSIIFDTEKGVLEITGKSAPEESVEFYTPLMNLLDEYSKSPKNITNAVIKLEYFNTSSSKCLLYIFKRLEAIHKQGHQVLIEWHYEENDEDMLGAGEDYQAIIPVPFKMVKIVVN